MDEPDYTEQNIPEDWVIFRASGFGGCTKALIAEAMELPKIESSFNPLRKYFASGHLYEAGVLEDGELRVDFKQGDFPVRDAQRQVGIHFPEYSAAVIGHIDGLVSDFVFDVKAVSPTVFDKYRVGGWGSGELMKKYRWQMSVYVQALRAEGVVIHDGFLYIVERLGGDEGLLEFNPGRSMTLRLGEEWLYTMDEIQQRVATVMTAALGSDLPVACDVPSYPCPYFQLHEDPDLIVLSDDSVIAVKLAEYQLAVTATEDLKKIKSELDELLGNAEVKYDFSGGSVTRYKIAGRRTLDLGKLEDEFPGLDLDEYKTTGESSWGTRVSFRKEG